MKRTILAICALIVSATAGKAQDYTEIMSRIIGYANELRIAGTDNSVYGQLQNDDSWTLMNEVEDDYDGQCSLREKIGRFGINDLAMRIEEKNRGKFESAGVFCNGTDPNYNYSFIEKSVRAGRTVAYTVPGREGMQQFVIVPFEKERTLLATATASGNDYNFSNDKSGNLNVTFRVKKDDPITLSVHEPEGKPVAFVIINYNSRR